MTANIVMIARDRNKLTAKALDSLIDETNPRDFNLTLLDDGSRVPMHDWQTDYCLTVRLSKSKGIVGFARNLAVHVAETYWSRGDLLYLSDNDVFFRPKWLSTLLVAWPVAKENGFRILGGYNHPYHHPMGAEKGALVNPLYLGPGIKIQEYYSLGSLSWLMEWETWDKYGPLEAVAAGVAKSEDHEFCQRVRRDGYKVGALDPHVVLNTGLTSTFGEKAVGHEMMNPVPGVLME